MLPPVDMHPGQLAVSAATVRRLVDEFAGFAHDLAEFIQGVRGIGTGGRTFSGQGRGGELRSHDEWLESCFERSEQAAGRAGASPRLGGPAGAAAHRR